MNRNNKIDWNTIIMTGIPIIAVIIIYALSVL